MADPVFGYAGFDANYRAVLGRHVLIIIDSCASGYLTKRGPVASHKEIAHLFTRPSRTVVAATTQTEAAKPGVFTPSLLEILKRHAKQENVVTVNGSFRRITY